MKKLLLIAGILALSTSLMGASAKDAKEGTVKVKAKVVQPLKIETTAVDFGILVPGENKYSETSGKIFVNGTPNELINLELKDKSGEYKIVKSFEPHYIVELKTNEGNAANEKMDSSLTIMAVGEGNNDISSGAINIGEEGSLEFNVEGTVNAVANQAAGEYEGVLYVRAKYN